MAATVIPGQPKRWGNESTNFYYTSYSSTPGVASKQKEYRCSDSLYTNSGHFHLGTKSLNLNPPLDQYGTAATHKLRAVDQLLPKALTTNIQPLSAGPPVNLYQSHQQNYKSYSMTSAPAQQSPSEEVGGAEMVARSLNRAFYTTSYQSHIDKYAAQRSRPNSANCRVGGTNSPIDPPPPTLRDNLETRRLRTRVKSAPPLRHHHPLVPAPPITVQPQPPTQLSRRRSFTGLSQNPASFSSSKGEMLKDIFAVFPAPQPQEASRWAARPSSAVSLRSGKIPHLRN